MVQPYRYCYTVLPTYSNGRCSRALDEFSTEEFPFALACPARPKLPEPFKLIDLFGVSSPPPHQQLLVKSSSVRVATQE